MTKWVRTTNQIDIIGMESVKGYQKGWLFIAKRGNDWWLHHAVSGLHLGFGVRHLRKAKAIGDEILACFPDLEYDRNEYVPEQSQNITRLKNFVDNVIGPKWLA